MPTLVEVEVSIDGELTDASETILFDDSTILSERTSNVCDPQPSQSHGRPIVAEERTPGHPEYLSQNSNSLRDRTIPNSSPKKTGSMLPQNTDWSQNEENRPNLLHGSLKKSHPHFNGPIVSPGPNQIRYERKFQAKVKETIEKHKRRYPGSIVDYRQLSATEKEEKQQHVLSLLARLRIGKNDGAQHTSRNSPERVVAHGRTQAWDRQRLLDETLSPLMSPADHHQSASFDNNESANDASNESVDLLAQSPSLLIQDNVEQHSPVSFGQQNASPASSVELARAAHDDSSSRDNIRYDSPAESLKINSSKRLASSSAKRGEDIARFRYSRDDIDAQSSVPSPREFETEDIDLSITPSRKNRTELFAASQSPISTRMTYDSAGSDDELEGEASDQLAGMDTQPPFHSDDTIQTFSSSVSTTRKDLRPMGVGLNRGEVLHFEKLKVKRSEKIMSAKGRLQHRIIDYPDPFVRYKKRERQVLSDVFDSICRSERESIGYFETRTATALFSMSHQQISDMCLKLLLHDESEQKMKRLRESNKLVGNTLIVVRTKEETAGWAKAFRECTGCSVFIHATLPLSERIRLSTAKKATRFDVVLTTYDALKSSDVTIALDEHGRSIVTPIESQNGWFDSRSSSSQQVASTPQRCKKLSVLHKINFERLALLDVLGRKSYLAKDGTARASAALAIRANSRLVFFEKGEVEELPALMMLRKSDKRAVRSLTSILHLNGEEDIEEDYDDEDDDEAQEDPLEACSLDLKMLLA